MNDVNRSIKVYIDSTEAGKNIEGLQAHIAKLEKDLNSLNKQDPAYAANAAKMQKSIESAYNQMGKYQKSVQEVDRVLNNLSGATYKELIAVQKKIERDLKNTARGTEEYNQKLEMHKKVSKEVALAQKEMRSELGSQASLWDRAKSWLTGSVVGFVSAAAAISGITAALSKYREERDKLESGQKELKALTGLDDQSITWLTENAKRLSGTMSKEGVRITQSAEQILEAYRIVGGEKPELLDNKEALASVTEEVLILAAASKMDLTEATRAVTLAMNQYSASAEEASRYTNVLAAGSKEGSAEVDSQAQAIKRSGVAAAAANIPIEQLVGSIQTLAEKGIKDEVAGTGLKKFFLTLQTGADDTNPKVVGLYTALDNLAKKQMQAADIKKMFGEEGYNVASVLINETEKVKAYTTAVTGTSVALEQAAINSDTAEARRAQRQNRLINQGISLLDKLAPSIEKVEEASATTAEALIMVGEWIVKNIGYIAALGKGLLVYTALVKAYVIQEKIRLLVTQAVALATKGLHNTLAKNPYAMVAALVVTWMLAMREANKELTEMQRSQKLLNDVESRASKSIAEQKVELESYLRIAKDDTKSKGERLAAIKKLNEISPEYLGNLTLEEIHTNSAKAAIDKYIQSITNLARAQAAREKLVEIEKERLRIEMDPEAFLENISTMDKLEVGFMRMFSGGAADQAMNDMVLRGRKKRDALLADLQRDADQLKGIIDSTMTTGTTPAGKTDDPDGAGGGGSSAADMKKANEAKLQEIDRYIAEKKLRISRDFIDGKTLYDDYNKQLEGLELESLDRKLSIYKVGSEERNKIEQLVLDYKVKMLEKGFEEYSKNQEKERRVDELTKKQKEKHYKELNEALQEFAGKQRSEQEKADEKELEKIEKKRKFALSFGEDVGQIIGESFADTESSFADVMANILLISLDALRQMALLAIAESTVKNVPKGPLGWAKIAAETALINAAFYAVKGLIKRPTVSGASGGTGGNDSEPQTGSRVVSDGYSSGGYTGAGAVFDVAGVVHRGEYVVPAWQMRDPVSFNYVRALEGIRQTRYQDDSVPGYASGGIVSQQGTNGSAGFVSPAAVNELILLLRDLRKKGIDARVVYSQFEKTKEVIERSREIGGK